MARAGLRPRDDVGLPSQRQPGPDSERFDQMADGKGTEETRRNASWRHTREDQADAATYRRSDSRDDNGSTRLYDAAPGIRRDRPADAAGMGERLQYLAAWPLTRTMTPPRRLALCSRRELLLSLAPLAAGLPGAADGRLDRLAIVSRHDPVLHRPDPRSPLSVGNGEFAFTADITGLQSFAELYEDAVPLCTQSQWGWHSFPALSGLGASDLRLETFDTYGRPVG